MFGSETNKRYQQHGSMIASFRRQPCLRPSARPRKSPLSSARRRRDFEAGLACMNSHHVTSCESSPFAIRWSRQWPRLEVNLFSPVESWFFDQWVKRRALCKPVWTTINFKSKFVSVGTIPSNQSLSFSSPTKIRTDSWIKPEKNTQRSLAGDRTWVFRVSVGRSNHWATKPRQELRANFCLSPSHQFFFFSRGDLDVRACEHTETNENSMDLILNMFKSNIVSVRIRWEIVTQWLSKLYRSPAIGFWLGRP